MITIFECDHAAPSNRSRETRTSKRPLWIRWAVLTLGVICLSAGASETLAQTPAPSPSPSLSPSPSPAPQSCNPTATANVTIAGGGGSFSPFSLTIDAATQVTWTNVGNSRARVRDVDHNFLDSDDLQPGQSFSFTFCVSGTYQIEDARSGVRSTITVVGGPGASPSPSPFPTPGTSPSPSPTPGASPTPGTSPSPSPGASPSPQPTCDATTISSVAIDGGGGPFNPSLLTINAGTRVTWTNIGNSRARVRDVDHTFLDSDDLEPGQSFSFTFCVAGTYRIEDARSNARATISVLGDAGASPSPSPSPSPGSSPSPTPGSSPSPSPGVSPSPSPSPSPATQPVNISTRLRVGGGESVMIGGFIVTGDDAKRVIIRGLGPSLSQSGVTGTIDDPILRLFGPTGFEIAVNDNWRDTQQPEVEASSIPPQNERESAIVATLVPAAYTASLAEANGGSGVGLVEVYDLNSGAPARLANISTRGSVQVQDNVMIGGFSLGGSSTNPVRVVVRAIGPSLTAAGVNNALSNPTLRLFDNNGQSVAFNDNWRDDPNQAAQLQALNIAPGNELESAIVTTLPPGLYTAVVAGHNGGVGIGLIEIYAVQ